MKIHKLKYNDLKSLPKLYKKIGAVSKDGKKAFVDCIYISPKTEKELVKVTTQMYKREYPYLKQRKIQASVAMYLLNLSPRCLKGLQDNVILIDDDRISEWEKNNAE